MKVLFTTLTFSIFTTILLSQAPQGINYQAIYRDASGQPAEQSLSVTFEIFSSISGTGTPLFSETHSTTSAAQTGLFNLKIGTKNPTAFAAINWASGSKFLKVIINGVAGPVTEMLSVPFALYAESAGNGASYIAGNGISISGGIISNIGDNDADPFNEIQTLNLTGNQLSLSNGGGSINLPTGSDSQTLSVNGMQLSISNGNSINLPQDGDGDSNNEIQTLSLSGSQLTLSNGGGSVDLPPAPVYSAGDGINISGNTISAVDNSPSNELQSLNLTGNTLSLTPNNGAPVDLSPFVSPWTVNGNNVHKAGGNVGIGITNPDDKLDVLGGVHITHPSGTHLKLEKTGSGPGTAYIGRTQYGFAVGHYTDPVNQTGYLHDLVVSPDGKVGIGGGVSPQEKLHVYGPIAIYREGGPNTFITNEHDPRIWSPDDGGATYPFNAGTGNLIIQPRTSSVGRDIVFITGDGDDIRMVISRNGRIGIGTNSPADLFHVEGTTRTKILTITGGSDITEKVKSEQNIQPGEVVVIDPLQVNSVVKASKAYDKTVLGVVSGAGGIRSGMELSQEGTLDGNISFAVAGRVYVKVTGNVKPGDLLTSSDVPGKAMAAHSRKKRDGAVIGKALTKPNDEGLVLMLVQTR